MQYIFWDFNGTILNDVELCYDILNEMLEEEQLPTVSMGTYLDIFTFPIIEYYQKVFDLNKTSFSTLANRFIKAYQPRSMHINLNKNVVKVIEFFKQKGSKNVVLSASKKDNLMEQLKHYQILDLFDDVLGIDDHFAASKLMLAKKYIETHHIDTSLCLMIGDTTHDLEIAEALNIKAYIYAHGHQSHKKFKKNVLIDDFLALIE